jgi:hypothetical protein
MLYPDRGGLHRPMQSDIPVWTPILDEDSNLKAAGVQCARLISSIASPPNTKGKIDAIRAAMSDFGDLVSRPPIENRKIAYSEMSDLLNQFMELDVIAGRRR